MHFLNYFTMAHVASVIGRFGVSNENEKEQEVDEKAISEWTNPREPSKYPIATFLPPSPFGGVE